MNDDRFLIFGWTVPLIAGYYRPNTTNCTVALRSACLFLTLHTHILEPNLSTHTHSLTHSHTMAQGHILPSILSLCGKHCCQATTKAGRLCHARMKVELYLCICGFVCLHEQVYAGVLSGGCTVRGRNGGINPVLKWDCLHYCIWTSF